jgi:hypothetical protein
MLWTGLTIAALILIAIAAYIVSQIQTASEVIEHDHRDDHGNSQ